MGLTMRQWPDSFDSTTISVFVLAVLTMVILGYVFAVMDVRRWLRSLRRALVKVVYCFSDFPEWARYETPPCLRAMGLRAPCTEEDVKKAYRNLAEELHPDRGGDRRRFMMLQEHFEDAINYVREMQPTGRSF